MIRTLTMALGLTSAFCAAGASAQTVINTIAGNGTSGFTGDNGQATAAEFRQPNSVAVDSSGNVYIADTNNARIRMINPSGVITTIAGNGTSGCSGDGGPASSASLAQPVGITVDSAGNLYIADYQASVVRKITMPAGTISTLAGKCYTGGEFGDGSAATSALLNQPSAVAVDASGNVYIADTQNSVIREISASTGNISLFAGSATDGFAGDGGSATATTAELFLPTGVAVDAAGNVYIADTGNNRVRKVSSGNLSTIAGNGIAGPTNDNSGGPATSAELYKPSNIALDSSGNLYIADPLTNLILEVSGGNISTVAGVCCIAGFFGDGGSPANALLKQPTGIAVDASGNLYIADTGNNRIREVTPVSAPAPTIKPSGIVPVDSTVSTVQPGEWISIYGANLGPGTPVNWNGNFPTMLGGTSVTIDGIPAYMYYVSASQVNVQVPDDAVTTSRSVNLVVNVGSQSVTSTVTLAPVAPSFALLGDNAHVAGIILRKDGSGAYGSGANSYDIIGPTGTSLGYKTVAAKAGDNVELFGFGFGPTSPSVASGQVYSGAANTVNAVTLTVGGQTVTTSFTGISEAGTYQFNFVVPAGLGTGDVAVSASVTGVSTVTGEPGAVIALQ